MLTVLTAAPDGPDVDVLLAQVVDDILTHTARQIMTGDQLAAWTGPAGNGLETVGGAR